MKVCLAVFLMVWISVSAKDIEYSNIWVAEVHGGENVAKQVCKDLGYTYHGKLKSSDDRYVITKDDIPEQSSYKSDYVTKELEQADQVKWAKQHPARPVLEPKALRDVEVTSKLKELCSKIEPPKGYTDGSDTTQSSSDPFDNGPVSVGFTQSSKKPASALGSRLNDGSWRSSTGRPLDSDEDRDEEEEFDAYLNNRKPNLISTPSRTGFGIPGFGFGGIFKSASTPSQVRRPFLF